MNDIQKAIEVLNKPSVHIKHLHKTENGMDFFTYSADLVKAFETAIDALKDIEKYRDIGTVEECREAREKQVEKPVNIIPNHVFALQCPICGDQNTTICKNVGDTYYCSGCGQKLVYLLPDSKGGDWIGKISK